MIIKYDKSKSGLLLTVCPRSIFREVMVGSKMCSRCKYFVSVDREQRLLDCKYNQHNDRSC